MRGNGSKKIVLSEHAKEQLAYRGGTAAEVRETIRAIPWTQAQSGRLECHKDFVYNKTWNGRHYKTKQVRPIFVEEKNEIVVVTVYVYYF